MNKKPFAHRLDDDCVQLYSGKQDDAVPFLSVRATDYAIVFQIPGGASIEVLFRVAAKFGLEIVDVTLQTVVEVPGLDGIITTGYKSNDV